MMDKLERSIHDSPIANQYGAYLVGGANDP